MSEMEYRMKKNLFVTSVVAILLFSLIGCQTQETTSPLSATLSELSGKVEFKQAGQEGFSLADANTTLEVNSQVQTGDDGRVRLDLSSGTIIRVSPSSFFTLTSNDETEGGLFTKIKLDLGKIFIILNGGQADVETPSGVASVRGSYMKVEVDPVTKNIYITCLEGNCSASNPAGNINFTNGEKVILYAFNEGTGTWTPPNSEPMTPEEFQEWLDNNPEAEELFNQAMGTATALAQPTNTNTPTASPTLEQALPPTDASSVCFKIIQPESGEALAQIGQQTFEWSSQAGAQSYVVTFINPNGIKAVIETAQTSITPYIEVFPAGGSYEWFVTAYDANGKSICSTSSNSFSKPKGDPTAKPTREPEPEILITPTITCDPCDYYGGCYDYYACFGGE